MLGPGIPQVLTELHPPGKVSLAVVLMFTFAPSSVIVVAMDMAINIRPESSCDHSHETLKELSLLAFHPWRKEGRRCGLKVHRGQED